MSWLSESCHVSLYSQGPVEKTSVSLGPLAFCEFDPRTLEGWGGGYWGTYYCLKGNSISYLVTVDVGTVLGPSRSFRGHCSFPNSNQERSN